LHVKVGGGGRGRSVEKVGGLGLKVLFGIIVCSDPPQGAQRQAHDIAHTPTPLPLQALWL